MATNNTQFEIQINRNGTWLDRHSGATDYLQAFSPDDLLFDSRQSAMDAIAEAGFDMDGFRVVEVDTSL
jgi:hypothetical protein